ncbi:MFS transporter [Phytoactinopolyspora limicola]|uniref:MFS transporter n=1 Tax=Phytoactinopolyspora limicola TaxID=2715536 RepID=UPI00140B7BDE|nr:MFS transporter [Phytoactinopolyspora limicola]
MAMSRKSASYREVFAVVEFRRLWTAHALSVIGDQLARVAITLLVYDRTKSAGLTALTYALTFVPDLLGGAALAGFADRWPRRRVMVVSDLARAGLVAVMAIPGIPLAVQAGLLFLVQLLVSPFGAARQTILADILPGDQLTLGLSAISTTYQGALVIGFGAGAALVAQLGVTSALLVDVVTFLVSAAIIQHGIRLHRPAASAAGAQPPGQWETIRAGCSIVARNPMLRITLAIACCSGFYVVPEGLAVPYAAETDMRTAAVGLLLAAGPAGTVAGMLLIRVLGPERRLALLGPAAVASSLVLIPTGWAPGLAIILVLWTLSGLFSAHQVVAQATYVRAAPPPHRGQAVGVAMAAMRAAQGAGIIAAGLLAQVLTPALIIALAAAVGTLVTAWAARRWARTVSSRPDPLRPG